MPLLVSRRIRAIMRIKRGEIMVEKVLEKLARGQSPELIEVANLISIIQEQQEEIKQLKSGYVSNCIQD